MKSMKAVMSLKQLRTDPREYIRLLKSGYDVTITEHRRSLVSAAASPNSTVKKRGDGAEILRVIDALPEIKAPFPKEDTVALMKRTRLEYLEKKYGYKK